MRDGKMTRLAAQRAAVMLDDYRTARLIAWRPHGTVVGRGATSRGSSPPADVEHPCIRTGSSLYLTRMSETTELTFSTAQAASLAGITYRQLDYWLRTGVVTLGSTQEDMPGSGHHRRLSVPEVDALCEIVNHYNEALGIIESFRSGALWGATIERNQRMTNDREQ